MERLRYDTGCGIWKHLSTDNHGCAYVPVCTMASDSADDQFIEWMDRTFDDAEFTRDYMEYSRMLPYNREELVAAFTYLVINSTLDSDPVTKYNLLEQVHERGLDTLELNWKRVAVAITIAGLITNKVYSLGSIMQHQR